ncbi:Hpt domain protein [Cellvibrio japonicus Ueda107]|uniref:Hpt domain protein n=2 Tax=Cellvibrio japonicus TaxID=155077 RepID=B3PEZ4_CELJU|nr:Hpt domain protein [Cellvibrio japonicus Ueda107]
MEFSNMNHLDYDALNTLRDVMEGDFPLLIDTFILDSTERLQKLHTIINSANADLIRRSAHSFKGSSSNIGAIQLAALCASLEKKALDGDLVNLDQDLRAIEQEYAQVENLLRAMLQVSR